MNRNRLIIGLFLAVVLALLLATFVYREFTKLASRPVVGTTQQIIVAAQTLPLGTRLEQGNLRAIPWPANQAVPAGFFTKIDECVGRALITSVAENEPILDGKLASKESGGGLPATIPQGMRAMSVAVNDVVGVAGFVGPGTTVDVLMTGAVPGANMATSMVTRTLLENIRVLAAGQKIEQDQQGKPQTVPVITLLVSPEDAAKLAMASSEGKIQLALRNTADTQAENPAPVFQSVLFGGGAPVAPAPVVEHRHVEQTKVAAPPPPAPYTIEVITGGKRETKSFPQQQPQQPQQ
jgi:pilus assembly protein CpaB